MAAVCVVRACAVLSAARVKYLSRSLACFLSLSLSSNSPSLLTLPLARFVFSLSLSLFSLSLFSLSLSLSPRALSLISLWQSVCVQVVTLVRDGAAFATHRVEVGDKLLAVDGADVLPLASLAEVEQLCAGAAGLTVVLSFAKRGKLAPAHVTAAEIAQRVKPINTITAARDRLRHLQAEDGDELAACLPVARKALRSRYTKRVLTRCAW